MPKKHALTKLIVEFFHCRLHHQNNELIVCEIRRQFWIPHLRSLVRRAKIECQHCKLRAAKPVVPMMGQLPADRLTPYVRPFTFTGLDYFGPFNVAIGRRREKRWVALFTCLTIRAVHLEIAAGLSTDDCILCLRNFVNRRGTPIRIRCDNGTNFVGAERELRNSIQDFDNDRITAEMSSRGIQWVFNCPSNPNAGGCWERQVKTVKRVLYYTLKEEAPREDTLRSLLIESENIVNSMPLTHVPVTTEDEEPLTANHLLIGTANSTQIPEEETTICLRKQWRICQNLKNRFWKRWIQEYLPTLTRRAKWFKRSEPLKIGDIVIICEDSMPRSQWRRGRVVKTYPGKDGQVRCADIKTTSGTLKRPASKLAVLDVICESERSTGVGMSRTDKVGNSALSSNVNRPDTK